MRGVPNGRSAHLQRLLPLAGVARRRHQRRVRGARRRHTLLPHAIEQRLRALPLPSDAVNSDAKATLLKSFMNFSFDNSCADCFFILRSTAFRRLRDCHRPSVTRDIIDRWHDIVKA